VGESRRDHSAALLTSSQAVSADLLGPEDSLRRLRMQTMSGAA